MPAADEVMEITDAMRAAASKVSVRVEYRSDCGHASAADGDEYDPDFPGCQGPARAYLLDDSPEMVFRAMASAMRAGEEDGIVSAAAAYERLYIDTKGQCSPQDVARVVISAFLLRRLRGRELVIDSLSASVDRMHALLTEMASDEVMRLMWGPQIDAVLAGKEPPPSEAETEAKAWEAALSDDHSKEPAPCPECGGDGHVELHDCPQAWFDDACSEENQYATRPECCGLGYL